MAFVYLHGKKSRGGDSNPAVQRVDVWYVFGIMDAKHGIKPHDRQHESEQHQRCVQQLPGEFILTPSQGDAVQHSSCGRDRRRVTDDVTATMWPITCKDSFKTHLMADLRKPLSYCTKTETQLHYGKWRLCCFLSDDSTMRVTEYIYSVHTFTC